MRKKIFLVLAGIFIFIFNFCFCAHADENENKNKNNFIRLGVMKFLPRAEGVTERQAAAIGDIFTRTLAKSKLITVVERDRLDEVARENSLLRAENLNFENDELIKIGKLISCKYILLGAVTGLEKRTSTQDLWIVNNKRQEITAVIDVRIVDVETGKIIFTCSESGSSSRKGSGFNFYGIKTDSGDFSGVEIQAISNAITRAGFLIREFLAGENIKVIQVATKEIIINAGENWNLNPGYLFEVYSNESQEKINLTPIAIIKIFDVQNDFSRAQVIKNGGKIINIHEGNILKPISQKDADFLIKQKIFSGETTKNKKSRLHQNEN